MLDVRFALDGLDAALSRQFPSSPFAAFFTPCEHTSRDNSTIHEMIELHARESPNDEAVCAWDGSLAYRDLFEQSSHVAAQLIDMGVGPESVVLLCFDKSKWNIVAMLSVLIAGGGWVPSHDGLSGHCYHMG